MVWRKRSILFVLLVAMAFVLNACLERRVEEEPENNAIVAPDLFVVMNVDNNLDLTDELLGTVLMPQDGAQPFDQIEVVVGDQINPGFLDRINQRYQQPGAEQNPVDGLDLGIVKPLLEGVVVYSFDPDDLNPGESILTIIAKLDEKGVVASPLMAVEYEGHWSIQPGTKPSTISGEGALRTELIEGPSVSPVEKPNRLVGIVDSGFLPEADEFVTFDSSRDVETAPPEGAACRGSFASHGTFIASLIHNLTGDAPVSIHGAAAPALTEPSINHFIKPDGTPVGDGAPTGECGRPDKGNESTFEHAVTDDLGIFFAIARTYESMLQAKSDGLVADGASMDLNLSFTTPAFDDLDAGLTRPPFFTKLIIEGLPALAAGNPDPTEVTFYAAAGNQVVNNKFFPATLDGVVSVAALDPAGRWVRWDGDGNDVALEDDQLSAWISDNGGLAPGCDLVGIGQPGTDSVTIWSGSSFATPIALVLDDGVSSPAYRLSDYDELGVNSPLLASSSAVLGASPPQCDPPGLACRAALLWCGDTWLTWWQWLIGLAVLVFGGGVVVSRLLELRVSERSRAK